MDMTDNNEQLIQDFFAEHMPEIEDNGFTERVMRRLPVPVRRINRIWTAICAAAGVAAFVLLQGWNDCSNIWADIVGYAATCAHSIDIVHMQPLTFAGGLVVLTLVAGYNAVTSEP